MAVAPTPTDPRPTPSEKVAEGSRKKVTRRAVARRVSLGREIRLVLLTRELRVPAPCGEVFLYNIDIFG